MSVETMFAVCGAVAGAMVLWAVSPIRFARVEEEKRQEKRPESWEELDNEERRFLKWWTRR